MRFYKPGNTEYQSQFAPLDLNFIQKIGAAKDTQSYAVDDMLDKADQLKIDAGMFSKKEEVDKYNEWVKTNVSNTRDQLLNQEITEEEAARNISKINSILTTSEAVKFFNADKKVTGEIRDGMLAGKYNKGISTNFNYLDPNNLQITPISYTEGLGALAEAGNIQVPGEFFKDHKDWYDKINTTQLGDIITNNGYETFNDPKLGLILRIKGGAQVTKGQFKEALRPYAKSYAEENFQNTSAGSVDYMRRLGKTEEDYENRLLDSYPGWFSLSEDTRSDTYKPLGTSDAAAAALNAPYAVPTSNITPVDQEWGVDANKFFDKRGIDGMTKWDANEVNRYVENMNDPSTTEGRQIHGDPDIKTGRFGQGAVESYINKNFKEVDLVQPYDLPELEGKIFNAWAATRPEYKEYADLNKSEKKDIPFEVLAKMTQGFLKDNQEYTKDVVKTATNASQINYHTDAEINDAAKRNTAEANYLRMSKRVWEQYTGNRPTATVSDVLSVAALNKIRIWSTTDKKFLNQEDMAAINTEHGKTNVPALNRTNPENLLNMLTGDETFKNAVTFSTPDGKQYMMEDRTFSVYTKGEEAVNTLYRKGKMALGQPVEMSWGDGTNNIKYKIDKDNQVILLNESGSPIKIKGKEIAPFENGATMLYQLSIENNPYLKQSLYPKAAKSNSATAKKPAAGKK